MLIGCFLSKEHNRKFHEKRFYFDWTHSSHSHYCGAGTEVLAQTEVKLQQQGVDVHLLLPPATVDDPSGHVIFAVTQF